MGTLLYCLETLYINDFFCYQFHILYSNEVKRFQTTVISSIQILKSTRDSVGEEDRLLVAMY